MYQVFQIKVFKEEFESTDPKTKSIVEAKNAAQSDLHWNGREGFVFNPDHQQLFTHVANVFAYDLDDAFRIMNRWSDEDESKVDRLTRLHSLSVGDVLVDEATGKAWLCAPVGWTRIEWEADDIDYVQLPIEDWADEIQSHV